MTGPVSFALSTCLNLNAIKGVLGGRIAAAIEVIVRLLDHEEPEVLPELPVPRPPDPKLGRGFALVSLLSAIG